MLEVQTYSPTKGEYFIEDYLFKAGIKYIEQIKIDNLVGDSKNYRVADFYLPRLGFYVVYEGLNNQSKEHRNQYQIKRNIYIKNGNQQFF